MSEALILQDYLKNLAAASNTDSLLAVNSSGEPRSASKKVITDIAFTRISASDLDLDNPPWHGLYTVNKTTSITRPTKGSGWDFGTVLNIALESGLQIWFNYSGYIAVRGKNSASSAWSEWSVMQKM